MSKSGKAPQTCQRVAASEETQRHKCGKKAFSVGKENTHRAYIHVHKHLEK